MNKFLNHNELNTAQLSQYQKAQSTTFPEIIRASEVGVKYWNKLDIYFPDFQLFLVSNEGALIGFINTIPFQFNKSLNELPQTGWDWMFEKGINDFEKKHTPNYLGGLQVIVTSNYQGQGYSKLILNYAKEVFKSSNLLNLVIPIRPTMKHKYPQMSMASYIDLKNQNEVYDPWIRTHLKSGAQIIKVCEASMSISGDLSFWEKILKNEHLESGEYLAYGGLNPVHIDVENNKGDYKEPNIWIKYD